MPGIEASGPLWSPDGRKIAFGAGDRQIHVMNADGSDPRRLTSTKFPDACAFANVGNGQYAWSPDGSEIAFVRSCQRFEIRVINTDGSNDRSLTKGRRYNADSPTWSPDGRRIAFRGFITDPGRSDIYVMNAACSHPRQLTK